MSSFTIKQVTHVARRWLHHAVATVTLALSAVSTAQAVGAGIFYGGDVQYGVEGNGIVVTLGRPGCCINVSTPITVYLTSDNYSLLETGRRTVTWNAGESMSKTITYTFPNDTIPSDTNWARIEANSLTNSVTYGITWLGWKDNDIALQVVQSAVVAAESSGNVNVQVRRVGSVGHVSVDYKTTDSSATAGNDYTAVTGTLDWLDGDQSIRTIAIPILADTVNELNEAFTVSLANPTNIGGAETVQLNALSAATVTIVNAAVNMPPVANDGPVTTNEDTPLDINLVTSELAWDPDGSEFFVAAIPTPPAHGSASFEGQHIIYTPALNFSGTDEFTYQVSDLQGATATAKITVAITAVNDPPVIQLTPLYRKAAANGVLNIDLTGNVSDPDGDIVVISATTAPAHGQITRGTGLNITYTPSADYIGEDQFNYYVTDQTETNNNAVMGTIIIDVSKANTAPLAVDLNANANAGQPVLINLANAVTDQDKDVLSITVPDRTAHGSLSVTGLVITYTPDPGFVGDDPFEYTVHDGFGGSATATITLRISAVTVLAQAINIKVLGGNVQLARLNNNVTLSVQVTDETGQNLAGVNVDWSATEPGGRTQPSIAATDPVTDASGIARAILTTSSTPTTYAVTVSVLLPQTETSEQATFTVATGLHALTLPGTPEGALAGVLDSMCPALQTSVDTLTAPQLELLDRCNEILNAATDGNDAQILDALRALAPDEAAAQGRIGNSFGQQQLSNIGARLSALRSGATGLGLAGLTFNIKGRTVPGSVFAQAAAPDAGSVASVDLPHSVPRWGGFISGTVGGGDKSQTASEEGFDFHTRGLTAGADYRYSSAVVFGGALGYARSDVNLDADGGGLDASGLSLSLYGTYYRTQSFYLDAVLNYAANNYDQTRNIDYFAGSTHIQETARSDTGGSLLALSVGGGYEFTARSGASTEISLRLHRIASSIDAYTETGADALNLALRGQSIQVFSSSLGTRGSWPLSLKWGVLIPQLDLSWEHELSDGAHQIKGSFVNDPFTTPFAFKTDDPDRDYFQLGLGASAILPGGKTAFLQYQTSLGRDHFRDYNVALGARVELR